MKRNRGRRRNRRKRRKPKAVLDAGVAHVVIRSNTSVRNGPHINRRARARKLACRRWKPDG